MIITKASGEQAEFSRYKLERSLRKSGVEKNIIEDIVKEIEKGLYPGISTQKIYRKAFALLKTRRLRPEAARYKLKAAIMELGPSGFPFERYVGEIFSSLGYKTEVGKIVQGHCVKHEVDVLAENDTSLLFIECKFRQSAGINSDVKVPLYINSRFQDIEKQSRKNHENNKKEHQGWIVTNTRFSLDAIQYGECVGLHLLGWDYPEKGNLKELIEKSGLHPLTALTTLSSTDKHKLLNKKIVLCHDITESILSETGFPANRIKDVMDECYKLCG